MFIKFGEKSLEDLYLTGSTDDKKYERLPKDIKKRYVKVVNMMRAARRIEDLFLINSLHYEKKEGDLKDVEPGPGPGYPPGTQGRPRGRFRAHFHRRRQRNDAAAF